MNTADAGLITGDDGRVTVFTLTLMPVLVMVTALVLDGGLALNQRHHALTLAGEAARVGAQELDLAAHRAGDPPRLHPAAAEHAARDFLTDTGAEGTITVDADAITVTAETSYTFRLLPLGTRPVTGTATARPHTP